MKYKIKYIASLNADINRLKQLHALKDKTQFKALKSEIMLKHNISKATVYREMRKKTPGLYKILNYKAPRGDVTGKELAMVRELLGRGICVSDICAIMESETGNKYPWDRVDKIRASAERSRSTDTHPGAERSRSTETLPSTSLRESCFGDNVRRLCEEALKYNYMSPDAHVSFTCNDTEYQLCYNDVKDIALVCANAVNRDKGDFYDYDTYSEMLIERLFLEKLSSIETAKEVTVKELLEFKKGYEEFSENRRKAFRRDFGVICAVIDELFRPGGSLDKGPSAPTDSKVYELVEKYNHMYTEGKVRLPARLQKGNT